MYPELIGMPSSVSIISGNGVILKRSLLAHEVRAVATDTEARKKFLRYWRWAKFGIITIRLLLLPAIKRKAEMKVT